MELVIPDQYVGVNTSEGVGRFFHAAFDSSLKQTSIFLYGEEKSSSDNCARIYNGLTSGQWRSGYARVISKGKSQYATALFSATPE